MTGSTLLGYFDVVSEEDLRELALHDGPCVSLFLPTARHGPETLEGPVRLKNLMRQAGDDLQSSGADPATAEDVVEPLRALADDAGFWQHQSDGLAVYVSATSSRHFRVPITFAEGAVVGPRFRLLPLWPLAAGDDVFFIIALSQNAVRVFEATRQTIGEVHPGPVPSSLAEALAHEDPERQLQSRSVGGSDVQFHGHGGGAETDKATLERYFRALDKGLTALLGATRQPVVLACVDYYLPIFQSVTKLANVAGTTIAGNPEHRTPDELLAAAHAIVDPLQSARRTATAERFASLAGTGRTLTDVAAIAAAAAEGRVETLLVHAQPPEPFEHLRPGVTDASIDLTVADVLAKGGAVEAVQQMPAGDALIAAILRY